MEQFKKFSLIEEHNNSITDSKTTMVKSENNWLSELLNDFKGEDVEICEGVCNRADGAYIYFKARFYIGSGCIVINSQVDETIGRESYNPSLPSELLDALYSIDEWFTKLNSFRKNQ